MSARTTLVAYSLPVLAYGFTYMLFSMYYMKFATDVLALSPILIGTIFGLARIWDSIMDPVAGYLSDRTVHRLGRRRAWLFYSAVPVAVTFVMCFSPPRSLQHSELVLWIIVSMFLFYTSITAFQVPHLSLGAELSYEGLDRKRLFGFRYVTLALGYAAGLGAIALLSGGTVDESRSLAIQVSLIGALAIVAFSWTTVALTRERSDFQGRVSGSPYRAFHDVLANPHERRVLLVTLLEYTGLSVTGVMSIYVIEYVIAAPGYAAPVLLVWLVMSVAGVPLWLYAARTVSKRNLWIGSLLISGFSYGTMVFLGPGDVIGMFLTMAIAGFGAAGSGTVGPAIQSDIVDYDELRSGDRKEGTYFASWTLVVKGGGGIASLLAGIVLQWSGFVPNVDQTPLAKNAMLAYLGLFPLVTYTLAALLLTRLRFDDQMHSRVRLELALRRNSAEAERKAPGASISPAANAGP